MAGVGRPSPYNADYHPKVMKDLALLGKTDEQVAEIIGVSDQTLRTWRKKHPEFLVASIEGKDIADGRVASALYERAMGYTHPEEKLFQNGGEVIRAETTKHYPPDTAAAMHWLKNRQRDNWTEANSQTGVVPAHVELVVHVHGTPETEKEVFDASTMLAEVNAVAADG